MEPESLHVISICQRTMVASSIKLGQGPFSPDATSLPGSPNLDPMTLVEYPTRPCMSSPHTNQC